MGFILTDSKANFIFARHEEISGEEIYNKLRERGVLVRYFGTDRIKDYVRITVGSDDEMDALINSVKDILRRQENA